jgi:sRNA-binding carbon storage regulator CsrA
MMLFNLKPGEKIHIAPGISVKIVEQSSAGVKVGIETPDKQRVYRESALRKVTDEHYAEFGGEA